MLLLKNADIKKGGMVAAKQALALEAAVALFRGAILLKKHV